MCGLVGVALVALATAGCGGPGVPYAKYESKVEENARLRAENRAHERTSGENDELRRRIAALEEENRALQRDLEAMRRKLDRAAGKSFPSPPQPVDEESFAGAIADVIQREQKSRGTRVTVNRGSNDGVKHGWILELVDSSGKPVARARGKVTYVGPTYCRAMIPVKIHVARRHDQAVLAPP